MPPDELERAQSAILTLMEQVAYLEQQVAKFEARTQVLLQALAEKVSPKNPGKFLERLAEAEREILAAIDSGAQSSEQLREIIAAARLARKHGPPSES